jgi:hypothetical protein
MIVSLSLGQQRTFKMYSRRKEKGEKKLPLHKLASLAEKKLASLSYLTMEGWFQKHMKHGLPKEEDLVDPRINITWRWIVSEEKRASTSAKQSKAVTEPILPPAALLQTGEWPVPCAHPRKAKQKPKNGSR